MVGTTIHELGVPVRQRMAKQSGPLKPEDIETQLAAFEVVNGRFYAIVLKTLGESEGTARQRNARTNFARSSASTVRKYIRTGHDLTCLVPAKVTKELLRVDVETRQPTLKRAEAMTNRLVEYAKTLDKEAAIDAIRHAMNQLSNLLLQYGTEFTTKPDEAQLSHKVFKSKAGLFWPAGASLGDVS
jgi:hypothetical protein